MLLLLGECLAWDFESRSRSRHLAKSNKVVKLYFVIKTSIETFIPSKIANQFYFVVPF